MISAASTPHSLPAEPASLSLVPSSGATPTPGTRRARDRRPVAALDLQVIEGLRRLESRIGRSVLPDMREILARHVSACHDRMREALTGGDAEALRQAAHKLKSSARCLGLLRLSETCAELERIAIGGDLGGCEPLVAAVEADYRQGAGELAELLAGRY